MIQVESLSRRFGGLHAVDNVSFTVRRGGITGVIGPNGAGKTTLMSLLGGQIRPHAGRILLDGRRIDGLPAHRVHAMGLVRSFQIPRPFRRLTVLENLLLARPRQTGERPWAALWSGRRIAAEEREATAHAHAILADLRLRHHADAPAGTLSGGQLKLLELGRALMAAPRVVVLDEPCAGVNPVLIDFLAGAIENLRRQSLTFIVVEHDIGFISALCDDVLVMAEGKVLMQGSPAALRQDPRMLEAFLGG